MSKKRKREVDLELVQVYEHLADDNEDIRLRAAHTLVAKIFKPGVTSDDQTTTILKRLFRGLCSSRKSARLGFSVALTELLSQLSLAGDLPASSLVDILETQTVPEGGTSGQDERDHYFGRVFGAGAVLKSGFLFRKPNPDQWKRVLDLICDLAIKKPWLRQECGWVVLTSIASGGPDVPEQFAIDSVEVLVANKLIRTPEGLAIWLTTARLFPHANLPKSVWKHGDPLATKDVNLLADILKDARSQSQADAESEAQGSARWSATLHFAWDVVLGELFRDSGPASHNGSHNGLHSVTDKNGRVTFALFWQKAVDESLFSPKSSTERKAWGLALWEKVFETAPRNMLQYTFTGQATACLVNSLKSSERLLQRHALRVSETFATRLQGGDPGSSLDQGLTGACFKALLNSVSFGDFDKITNTKTIQNIIDTADDNLLRTIADTLLTIAGEAVQDEDEKRLLTRQKAVIGLQFKVITAALRNVEQKALSEVPEKTGSALDTMETWISETFHVPDQVVDRTIKEHTLFPPKLLPGAREFMVERLTLAFEQTLKLGAVGCRILRNKVMILKPKDKDGQSLSMLFEEDIKDLLLRAWQKLTLLSKNLEELWQQSRHPGANSAPNVYPSTYPTFSDGLCLLYCLVLFQIYTGQHEAVEILQDLLEYHDHWEASKSTKSKAQTEDNPADAMIEIILSFASTPSKFLKRITLQIFEAFAPYVSRNGLDSLCRILETKENVQGQQEMFKAEDVEMEDGEDASSDSDAESLDSDVEVESMSSADGSTSGDGESGTELGESDDDSADESGDDEGEEDEEDEELAAFDAALASALGTRRLDQNDLADGSDSESSAGSDMDDDEMMELDSKLAEVFRAREEQQSKNKKKVSRDAKENVVNFKNRVLDLLEAYLKHQQLNPFAIYLVVPLLQLARTTSTKQLAERGCSALQQFCGRCKGSNVPMLTGTAQVQDAIQVLQSIHDEACMESSNAHSKAAGQASLLLVKILVHADPVSITSVLEIYTATRLRQLTQKKCRVSPGFFTEWNNWCQTAREKLAR
ncbi:DNA-directed DNA polymerase [Exophiala xenobiotica]|nr:DNA-directed DNA polymerase [Exophiala xenobiotica]